MDYNISFTGKHILFAFKVKGSISMWDLISHFDIPEPTTEIGVRDYVGPKQGKLIVFVHCGILIGLTIHGQQSSLLTAPCVKFSFTQNRLKSP